MALKIMPKFRITTKILLILLGLSLISLISFSYIAFSNMEKLGHHASNDSRSALINEAEQNLLRSAKDQAAISDAIFGKVVTETNIMAQFASNIWSNPSFFGYRRSHSAEEEPDDIHSTSSYVLAPGVSINAVRKELALSSNMDSVFIPIHANDPNLAAIYIGTESGIHRRYPWYSGYDPSYDPRKRSWYQRAVETGETGWSELYIDASQGGLMVTCSKPVHTSEGKTVGVVGSDITLGAINEGIINSQIDVDGYAFLVDEDGKVIASEGLSAENKSWDETFETENLLNDDDPEVREIAQDMIAGKTGIRIANFEGSKKYIAYASIDSTNWSIGIVMPVTEIIAPALITESKIAADTRTARTILISILIVMLFVVSGIAYGLSRKITKPILDLDNGARIVGSGNLDYQLEVRTGDEIEDLANTFNKMTSDLKIYMENLKETTAAKERIESELKIATEIQASMLPRIFPPFPNRDEFDIFATMEPAKEVGGDFYDFFLIGESKLCFLIGDVSGKGVPASLFMVISKTLLKTEALRGHSPDEVLSRVNNILYPDNDTSMFVTVFCVILDMETGEIQFANAGHNPPLIRTDVEDFEFVQVSSGFVVGPMPDTEFESQKLTLKKNDVIFLYTDGVTEAMNPEDQQFSEERLKECLSGLKEEDITNIIHGVRAEIGTFAQGASQSDDITMLALKFNG